MWEVKDSGSGIGCGNISRRGKELGCKKKGKRGKDGARSKALQGELRRARSD